VPSRVIENYEPDDRGWGIVIGRSMQKPEPKPESEEQGEDAEKHE
jgi:hypothetical protein